MNFADWLLRAGNMARRKKDLVGIIYDFDGTLSPDNMQEDTIFRDYGVDPAEIWKKADRLVRNKGYERTLAYLKLLIHDPVFREAPLKRERLRRLASRIRYFPGVSGYFKAINRFAEGLGEKRGKRLEIEHYIVSSGMTEILEGTKIFTHFKRVYACSYEYSSRGAVFPKLVINDTNKTQFLFRISKGKLNLSEDVNAYTPHEEYRIPFRKMIYIGDSLTDIPSMAVVQKFGGTAIAVYDGRRPVPENVREMVRVGRVDHLAPADYRSGSALVKIIRSRIETMTASGGVTE